MNLLAGLIKTLLAIMIMLSASFAQNEVLQVDLYIRNHHFEPAVITLPANTKIKLTIHNEDSTVEEFESHDLKREKIVPGKSQVNIMLAPLKVGEYKFFGEFNEETAQGKIVVIESETK